MAKVNSDTSPLIITSHPDVAKCIARYPAWVQEKLARLRSLILTVAEETEGISQLEETLKWGEPSYLVKKGSTLRIDWKPAQPAQYAMYVKCTSLLMPTFRELYGDLFHFEGNRAIIFQQEDALPLPELTHCIQLALTYHRVKHLPLLGA
ncbi:MAG: DUF1801 domain-containing protein [Bacteroidota bacterium]